LFLFFGFVNTTKKAMASRLRIYLPSYNGRKPSQTYAAAPFNIFQVMFKIVQVFSLTICVYI